MSERRSAFDLAESFHLASALAALREMGIDEAMIEEISVEQLAHQFKLDSTILHGVFRYLAAHTDLVECNGDSVQLSDEYDVYARFIIDQYLGAYGNNSVQLHIVLQQPQRAGDFVNRLRHARAFESLGRPGVAMLPDLVRQLEFNYVLDLGCGPGAFLFELAEADLAFHGWGIDSSLQMCDLAQAKIDRLDLNNRLQFFSGDARRFADILPKEELAQVQTIIAASLLNELFADTGETAVALLKSLRLELPGRVLLVSDYYGCLGYEGARWYSKTALHDYVQLISGQGIPPPDISGWQAVYSAAGCQLVHAFEDENASGFVHLVRL